MTSSHLYAKPSKLESMYQRSGLTCYKSTSHKLRILYFKSFLILNKFQLFRDLIKEDGVLCFQNIDFDSNMARTKYLSILSGTCVARKKQITPVLSVKSIWWATENTLESGNKEIYPSFKKSGDSGFMKGQRNLSLITSQPTRLTRLHPISDWEKVIAFWFDITIGCKRSQNKGVCYWAILDRQ